MSYAEFRQLLETLFNDKELRDLCFDLDIDIDYDSLPGQSKGEKARELIAYCVRHECLDALVKACRRSRPSAFKRVHLKKKPSRYVVWVPILVIPEADVEIL